MTESLGSRQKLRAEVDPLKIGFWILKSQSHLEPNLADGACERPSLLSSLVLSPGGRGACLMQTSPCWSEAWLSLVKNIGHMLSSHTALELGKILVGKALGFCSSHHWRGQWCRVSGAVKAEECEQPWTSLCFLCCAPALVGPQPSPAA